MPKFRDELADGGKDIVTIKIGLFRETRYALQSSSVNKIEQSLAKKMRDIEADLVKLAAARRELETNIKEKKRSQGFNRLGEGPTYSLSTKEASKKFSPLTDKPDPSWMLGLNPLLLRKYGISTEGVAPTASSQNVPPKGSPSLGKTRHAYTHAGLADKALHLAAEHGATGVSEFREDKGGNKGSDQDLKGRIKRDNPQEPNESNDAYGKRIAKLVQESRNGNKSD